jgi:hypothetical protein
LPKIFGERIHSLQAESTTERKEFKKKQDYPLFFPCRKELVSASASSVIAGLG